MIEFKDNIPIYVQIMEDIKMQIITKKLAIDDKVPSVRELALLYGVNPNTIQKALSELEREGLIRTERTSGKFICATAKQVDDIRETIATIKTDEYIQDMYELGYQKKEIMKLIEKKEDTNNE